MFLNSSALILLLTPSLATYFCYHRGDMLHEKLLHTSFAFLPRLSWIQSLERPCLIRIFNHRPISSCVLIFLCPFSPTSDSALSPMFKTARLDRYTKWDHNGAKPSFATQSRTFVGETFAVVRVNPTLDRFLTLSTILIAQRWRMRIS